MEETLQIVYDGIKEDKEKEDILKEVAKECFKQEKMKQEQFYISVTLTNNEKIKAINKEYRQIEKETDVLSFPMFEKEEIKQILEEKQNHQEILGDIVISIPKVEEQALEYGHAWKRELAYMFVHGFYHLMGYDHMEEEEKKEMRKKEENVLSKLKIQR